MFSVDMNKRLWRDSKAFEMFVGSTMLFEGLFLMEKVRSPEAYLPLTNSLDDLMQDYEGKYGPIEDPNFFWYFATLNGLSLNAANDEIGSTRIGYIVNGYKEGLNKHLLYPSYTAFMIETAIENIGKFSHEQDKVWLSMNRNKFTPVPDK